MWTETALFICNVFNNAVSISNLREIGWGGMEWTNLAQDRDQWRALVNTVMNIRVP
jgi:hypothetical protein